MFDIQKVMCGFSRACFMLALCESDLPVQVPQFCAHSCTRKSTSGRAEETDEVCLKRVVCGPNKHDLFICVKCALFKLVLRLFCLFGVALGFDQKSCVLVFALENNSLG
jgi:hypothetical protein